MEFKKHYTDEEIEEVIKWFEDHFDTLPTSIDVDKATHIADFPHTVKLYFDIARAHKDNPTYAAQIHHLFKMRDAVERGGKEE